MSVKYEVIKKVVKVLDLKKEWAGKGADEIIEQKKKENAKNYIPKLSDDDFEISQIQVDGFTVIKMIHKTKVDNANLFIIGGGMVMAPRPDAVKKALKFAKETAVDVFVPYYPLCTDYPLTKAYGMIHETYKEMLKDYEAENISVLGTSSGGNLALGIVPYINDGHDDTPVPGHIIAISPGTCVDTEEEWQRMLELDEKDVAIPAEYMKTAVDIMRHGDDTVPEYMIWLQKGDFTGCPPVTFIYGSDETLYGCAPSFEAAMKKYDVDYEMIVGEGMFHCYPVFPLVKEAKEGWDMMVDLVRDIHAGTKVMGITRKRPDYKNWVPKGMVDGLMAGTGALLLGYTLSDLFTKKSSKIVKVGTKSIFGIGTVFCGACALWCLLLYKQFSYDGKRKMSKQIIDGVAKYVKIPDGGTGIDVGCGSGALTIACAKRNVGAKMVGIDRWGKEYASFSRKLCEDNSEAEGVTNTSFTNGDAIHLDYDDETFDAVTSNYVYHNITGKDKQDLLRETLRVLKKGGTFAIHDIMSRSRYGDMEAFIDELKSEGYEEVRLIHTDDGMFMSKAEAAWMGLSGSCLLVGKK
ncbi:Acetyl esterase/lipase [Lachnospiraceae bacterium NE2001]|nr:Acetyl esterase/lipase [Lachnospiraceae bacterium NE2001]